MPCVLLVDDDVNLLHGLCRTLRSEPYRLLTARSAEEAEHVVRTHKVDLIVSDERMPGKPGTQMLSWVAATCPEIVRIVLTGHPDRETLHRARTKGQVFRIFTKPFNSQELAVAIREGLEPELRAPPVTVTRIEVSPGTVTVEEEVFDAPRVPIGYPMRGI